MQDAANTVQRKKLISLNACNRKVEISKINNISFYIRKLKKKKIKCKASEEIMKIRIVIYGIENRDQ